jgi:sec-independent protein translocase protein TatC
MADEKSMTFWDHLDELRGSLFRMLAAVAVTAVISFSLKDLLFEVILAPTKSDFVTYRLLGAEPFTMQLINTQLTEQLMVHLRMAAYMGFLLASPFLLYELFRFVSPALYRNERKYATIVVVAAYVMFIIGTLLNYFLIFPLIARFLGTYQVSPDVENMLTLNSYVDTMMMMSLVIGIVFEMPVVAALMGKLNIISAKLMKRYRKHALVVILIVAAIITPTADIFTLLIVSLPIWALYETSILIVKKLQKQK